MRRFKSCHCRFFKNIFYINILYLLYILYYMSMYYLFLGYSIIEDNVAEWLRRLPAKQFPFGSVGSNPAVVVFYQLYYVWYKFNIIFIVYKFVYRIKKDGGAGYRSPCPSHAKRVLYHLSYTPIHRKRRTKGVVSASFNLSNILWGYIKKIKTLQRGFEPRSFT